MAGARGQDKKITPFISQAHSVRLASFILILVETTFRETSGMEQTETTSGVHAQPRLSRDWPVFSDRLASVLAGLAEDHYLVLSGKRSDRYIQFAAQGSFGLRAETTSNAYLSKRERLSEEEIRLMQETGWLPPTGGPAASTPESDPDGSPNFYIDFPAPVAHAEVAWLAVTTLSGILRIPHPGFLEYGAFDAVGNSLLLTELGLKRAERTAPLDCDALSRQLLAAMREITGIDDLEYDEDGDIAIGYDGLTVFACLLEKPPHIRIHAPLMLGVRQSLQLLVRLNEFNSGAGYLHFFFREGNIYAMADLPAVPMVARHLSGAFRLFCEVADGVGELLTAEFGGTIRYTGDMPSRLRH